MKAGDVCRRLDLAAGGHNPVVVLTRDMFNSHFKAAWVAPLLGAEPGDDAPGAITTTEPDRRWIGFTWAYMVPLSALETTGERIDAAALTEYHALMRGALQADR